MRCGKSIEVSVKWNFVSRLGTERFSAYICSKITAAQVNQGLDPKGNYGHELERRTNPRQDT